MWHHRYEATTTLSCDQLWPVLADIAGWPKLDRNIEYLLIEGEPAAGRPFVLKVRNGPKLNFVIGEFAPPSLYSDVCHMPLASMTTRHALLPAADGTTIRVDIEIVGPLARLWGMIVGRKHAQGLPAQTARFIAGARSRMGGRALAAPSMSAEPLAHRLFLERVKGIEPSS